MVDTNLRGKRLLNEITIVVSKAEVALRARVAETNNIKAYKLDVEISNIFKELNKLNIELKEVAKVIKRRNIKLV